MTVSTILAGKGREVVSVEPSASLAHAVRLLAGKRIGAAVILGADRRIAGIISERDSCASWRSAELARSTSQ